VPHHFFSGFADRQSCQRKNGAILKLAGRTSKTTSNEPYLVEGILEDLFELGGLKALRTVSAGIRENIPPEEFSGIPEKDRRSQENEEQHH